MYTHTRECSSCADVKDIKWNLWYFLFFAFLFQAKFGRAEFVKTDSFAN